MARIERRRDHSLWWRGTRARSAGRGEHDPRRVRGGAGRGYDHASAIWHARRLAERQWLGRRFGGGERRLRLHAPGGGGTDRTDRGRAGAFFGRVARIAAGGGRPWRLDIRACGGRRVGGVGGRAVRKISRRRRGTVSGAGGGGRNP